jgi:hypothetical protein
MINWATYVYFVLSVFYTSTPIELIKLPCYSMLLSFDMLTINDPSPRKIYMAEYRTI